MKVKLDSTEEFAPQELTITFETPEEMMLMWYYMFTPPGSLLVGETKEMFTTPDKFIFNSPSSNLNIPIFNELDEFLTKHGYKKESK